MRPNRWLRSGERLFVPTGAPAAIETPASGETPASDSPPAAEEVYHVVKPGESWNSIARIYGVPARVLRAANPRSVRADLVLYRGERLLIPPSSVCGS